LGVEGLEDRTLLSTLYVEPLGYPLNSTHVLTLQDALGAATDGDVIIIEPGTAIRSVGAKAGIASLGAAAAAGATSVTSSNYVPAGEVINIGTGATAETDLILTAAPAPGGQFTLALKSPLAHSHASAENVDTVGDLGIGKSIVLQGDPVNGQATVSSALHVWAGTSGVTLQTLTFNGTVTLEAGSSGTTIQNDTFARSTQVKLVEVGGTSQNGNNVIRNNMIGANVSLAGNTSGTATSDQVLFNQFLGGNLTLAHDDGTTIQGNTFDLAGSGTGISIPDSQNVTVSLNTISIVNAAGAGAIGISVGATSSTGTVGPVNIFNNEINTNGLGRGVLISNAPGNGSNLRLALQGNDFRFDVIGIEDVGDGTNGLNAAGLVDAGGGVLGSLGANNFRGIAAADAASGTRFAIYLHNTIGTSGTITAQNNLYSVTTPTTIVKDGSNNTDAGSPPLGVGSGTVNVGLANTQLSQNEQFVQALYNDFLGRNGAVAELDGWVAQLATIGTAGVANKIIRSPEALTRLVDSFYFKYLNRPADATGEAFWVSDLQNGATQEQVVAAFVSSGEYYDRLKTLYTDASAAYVQTLYQNVLGRTGSNTEIAFWLAQLPTLGRDAVALAFAQSSEYRTQFVLQFYYSLLHRTSPPSAAELNGFVNSTADYLAIEVAFGGSGEFYVNG
jgi:hypothetical protein